MVSVMEASASLVLQIAVLVLLIAAIVFKNKKKFRQHGFTMTSAVILHLLTVAAVMGPSFRISFSAPGIDFLHPLVILSLVHVALGATAIILGIWLIVSWHFKTDLKNCFTNRKIMRPTFFLWAVTVLLGIVMYILFWTSSLLLS